LTRLHLRDFRSYPALDLACEAAVLALTGENGAGKTNLIEAVSLLAQGRGLRRADMTALARIGGAGGFTLSAIVDGEAGEHRLGLGLSPPDAEGRQTRSVRIDGTNAGSVADFAEYLRVVWLTPDMDGLFRGAAGERRRFLDRLVLAVDATHGSRTAALERALRQRNRILDEDPDAQAWLDAIEREVAEAGIAVTTARAETVARLNALIAARRDDESPFPHAGLALSGEIDALIAGQSALEAEDAYRALLRQSRPRDRAAARTLVGPQASDLVVTHGPKDMPAALCSTGEQKALLIGLVIAHARLVSAMSGLAPLVLLDEVAAHLDPRRRAALFAELAALECQCWLTGADPALFAELPAGAQLYDVSPGAVRLRV
jgi:DNA replication and repair protein RecF